MTGPLPSDIGDVEGLVVGAAGKAELQPVTHGAVGAVAADEVVGEDRFAAAVTDHSVAGRGLRYFL